ncbi:hypothetical protein AAF712_003548 [Marasmius tenuissimus]|uniref:Tetratricopeptide repeat (TPR)-like superfamily protein n=1 Tax=Marasmius tenuissimus TaxID=585030 RepID=A0ABR3A948_9AGAR
MSESSSTIQCSSPQDSLKWKRDDEDVVMEENMPVSSPLTELSSSPAKLSQPSSSSPLAALPPAVLLISLPGMLLHPPNHPMHAHSLCISLLAVRRCLRTPGLSPEIECRAWTAIAELGMNVLEGGFSHDEEHIWAHGVESEVEEATSKGLLIAQKHPTLRSYRSQLTFLAAQLAVWQKNVKFAQTLLRRHITTFIPADPPHLVYTAHLEVHNKSDDFTNVDIGLSNMQNLAVKSSHTQVDLLTRVLRLRLLVSAGQWDQVEEALTSAEEYLGIDYPNEKLQPNTPSRLALRVADLNTPQRTATSPSTLKPCDGSGQSPSTPTAFGGPEATNTAPHKTFSDPFSTSMAVHTLIIGVVFYTYVGRAVDSSTRLSHLHSILDSGVLKFPAEENYRSPASGIIEVPFPKQKNPIPMYIQVTHPRILYVLAYLVSAVAKKDPVGRKPKRKIFSTQGLATWEKEVKKELKLPVWATVADAEHIDDRMAKIKGDLMCELIGVSIMRSELDSAEKTLSLLIAHLRTHGLFDTFAARVTLHHAHLAQTKGDFKRAMRCYKVAARVGEEMCDDFARLSAKAGLVTLRIGILRMREMRGDETKMEADGGEKSKAEGDDDDDDSSWEDVERMGVEVADACKGMGGTMWIVGRIIEACLSDEILKAKQDLRTGLNFASSAGDNHIRALILALIASHFFHTSADDSLEMLTMCGNLAAGFGAVPGGGKVPSRRSSMTNSNSEEKKPVDGLGNVPLRMWVGERSLDIHRRTGNTRAARKQETANAALGEAVAAHAAAGST